MPGASTWFAAHKTADYENVIADSGIVVTPSSAYVMSLIANGRTGGDTRAALASVSAAVYAAFANASTRSAFLNDLYLLFADDASLR